MFRLLRWFMQPRSRLRLDRQVRMRSQARYCWSCGMVLGSVAQRRGYCPRCRQPSADVMLRTNHGVRWERHEPGRGQLYSSMGIP